MPLPSDPVGFSPRGAGRVASAARKEERFDRLRYNGTGPRPFAPQPRQRNGWPVRITGPASPGDPLLYPGVLLEFEGYFGTPQWTVGEACWVVPLDTAGTDSLEPGDEIDAELVGVTDDGEQRLILAAVGSPYLWAELTGSAPASSAGGGVDADGRAYSWTERKQAAAGRWTDGTRSGTRNGYAVEPSGGFAGIVSAGTTVLLRQSVAVPGTFEFLPPASSATGSGASGSGNTSGGAGTTIEMYGPVCLTYGTLSGSGQKYAVGGQQVVTTYRLPDWSVVSTRCVSVGDCSTWGLCPSGASGSGSSGSGTALGGLASCCGRKLNVTLYATCPLWTGSKALAWNGVVWLTPASFILACRPGVPIILNMDTSCVVSWSDDGGGNWNTTPFTGSTTCSPPFLRTGNTFSPGGTCGVSAIAVGE